MPVQDGTEQRLALAPLADVLEFRLARPPEEIVGIDMRAPQPRGQRPPSVVVPDPDAPTMCTRIARASLAPTAGQ